MTIIDTRPVGTLADLVEALGEFPPASRFEIVFKPSNCPALRGEIDVFAAIHQSVRSNTGAITEIVVTEQGAPKTEAGGQVGPAKMPGDTISLGPTRAGMRAGPVIQRLFELVTAGSEMTEEKTLERAKLLADEMDVNDEENRAMQSEIDILYAKIDAAKDSAI